MRSSQRKQIADTIESMKDKVPSGITAQGVGYKYVTAIFATDAEYLAYKNNKRVFKRKRSMWVKRKELRFKVKLFVAQVRTGYTRATR